MDAEAKLAKVKKAKDAASAAFSSMKASGLGGVELNREMYIKLEEEIAETRTQLKVRGLLWCAVTGYVGCICVHCVV